MKNTDKSGPERRYDGSEEATERFVIRPPLPPRTLLPGEACASEEGAVLALTRDIEVAGVAGTGGIALDGARLAGGWCSFRCRLAVPRRFAAREGARLAAGTPVDAILRGKLGDVLTALLAQSDCPPPEETARLKMRLNRELRDAARRELMDLGWQLTHCRLEKLLITRR